MPRFQQGGPIPHKKPGEGSDAPPTLERSGSERQEERLHPLPFWKGRGLGSGLRTPSSQEGDRGVEKFMITTRTEPPLLTGSFDTVVTVDTKANMLMAANILGV